VGSRNFCQKGPGGNKAGEEVGGKEGFYVSTRTRGNDRREGL